MYNSREHAIGLKFAREDDPRAYPVRAQSSSTGNYQTAGKAFLKHHGIPIADHARRFPATLENGILVVRLNHYAEEGAGKRQGAEEPGAVAS
jgi:hypothetical protein